MPHSEKAPVNYRTEETPIKVIPKGLHVIPLLNIKMMSDADFQRIATEQKKQRRA